MHALEEQLRRPALRSDGRQRLNGWGNTALFTGVFNVKNGNGQVVRTLLSAGASPDLKNNHGVSPRELGAKVGNHDLTSFFDDQA